MPKIEEKEKLMRCGMCGEWLSNPEFYTEEEQEKAELTYCSQCQFQEEERLRYNLQNREREE